MKKSEIYKAVYEVVQQIPKGKVATYGDIAWLAGNSKMARLVGNALHENPKPGEIPCHRVVNREGRMAPGFAFGGPGRQRELLEAEGVVFKGEKADIKLCRWEICRKR